MSEFAGLSLWHRLQASVGRPFDLVGLGECSLDRVLRLPGRLADLSPLLSDALSGGKVRAQSMAQVGGGQIATALCAASRLGLRTAFCGVVGDDSDGREIQKGLREEGVDVTWVHVLSDIPTRSALILVDEHGERLVIEHRHPALLPPADRDPVPLLRHARVVHVDATCPEAALALLTQASACGCVGSLDLDHAGLQALPLLQAADLSVLSASVAMQITREPMPDSALRHLSQRLRKPLVATLGEQGSILALPTEQGTALVHQSAFPAMRSDAGLCDTTACGDTYRAALWASILQALDEMSGACDPRSVLANAMRAGSAAAAIKCRDLGRWGCPTTSQLSAFLRAAELRR